MASNEENVDQFCCITGVDRELAKNLLEACGNNLEMAVNMHIENGEGDPGPPPPAAAGASNSRAQNPPPSRSVIKKVPCEEGAGGSGENGQDYDEDEVRAPIPQRQEMLVQPGFEGYEMNNRRQNSRAGARVRSVFDGFRNFEAETLRREREEEANIVAEPVGYNRSKKRTLEELFKPPLDIMFQGDWQSARDRASSSGRWLLVNIQEPKEFQCQVLNRDLWSNPGVKTIVGEHFVFWQQYKESDEAQRYMTFYKITDWPYIAVIDPRTGENMATWSHIDANAFPELITEFLTLHPSLETPEKEPPRKRLKGDEEGEGSVADLDEDAQLAAAIKASLSETLARPGQEEHEDLSLGASDEEDGGRSAAGPSAQEAADRLKPGTSSVHSSSVSSVIVTNGTSTQNGEATGSCGDEDRWKQYLGPTEDPPTNILIRYPDGTRDPWNYPSTSKLKALIEFIEWKGYKVSDHEIITNYPRRIISELDQEKSVKDHQLFPRETVFVQLKD